MQWQELISALALVVIFETLLPFISPMRARKGYFLLAKTNNKTLRTMAGIGLVAASIVLYVVKS